MKNSRVGRSDPSWSTSLGSSGRFCPKALVLVQEDQYPMDRVGSRCSPSTSGYRTAATYPKCPQEGPYWRIFCEHGEPCLPEAALSLVEPWRVPRQQPLTIKEHVSGAECHEHAERLTLRASILALFAIATLSSASETSTIVNGVL